MTPLPNDYKLDAGKLIATIASLSGRIANRFPHRILGGHEKTDDDDLPMSPVALRRYLDYGSEMLSLTGKIASLYSNHFEDQVTVAAVNEIEELTTGLSRKIWQKIISSQALNS